jgi:hypothetical protein
VGPKLPVTTFFSSNGDSKISITNEFDQGRQIIQETLDVKVAPAGTRSPVSRNRYTIAWNRNALKGDLFQGGRWCGTISVEAPKSVPYLSVSGCGLEEKYDALAIPAGTYIAEGTSSIRLSAVSKFEEGLQLIEQPAPNSDGKTRFGINWTRRYAEGIAGEIVKFSSLIGDKPTPCGPVSYYPASEKLAFPTLDRGQPTQNCGLREAYQIPGR